MSPAVLNYLGLGASPVIQGDKIEANKTPIRALPAPWFTSPEMYEFERRSIFSRRWLFITHKSRLQESGSYLRYNVAGFDFVLVRDRSGKINAFHNVCRHRAYPVLEPKQGKANIIACRYHGWSYGLDGKLAKAPNYQELDGFDMSLNGLFPIHVHIDVQGFIWVNFDAQKSEPEVRWEDDFVDVDKQERFEDFNFDDYVLDHTYELEGGYNWKILADSKRCHPSSRSEINVRIFADCRWY